MENFLISMTMASGLISTYRLLTRACASASAWTKGKIRRHPEYVARLYAVLNRFMDAEFTFYDFSALSDANLIILKDQFVIQYSLQSHRGMMMCSYIDDPAVVHDITNALASTIRRNSSRISRVPGTTTTATAHPSMKRRGSASS